MAIETRDGVEIEVGDWVVAGEGSDRDCGRVSSIAGEVVRVYWESGVETPCDVASVVGVYTSRPASW